MILSLEQSPRFIKWVRTRCSYFKPACYEFMVGHRCEFEELQKGARSISTIVSTICLVIMTFLLKLYSLLKCNEFFFFKADTSTGREERKP